MHRVLACAGTLLLAGCFDFGKLDHLPDVAVSRDLTFATEQVDELIVGFNLAHSTRVGTTRAWVDAVELRHDSTPIGCPYPLE